MATQDRKETSTSALENQAVALAEQLGHLAGTIEGTAEQWLNRPALTEQLTRVRDSASQLIDSLATGAARGREAAASGASTVGSQVRDAASKAVSAASSAMSSLKASRSKARRPVAKSSSKRTRMDASHAPGKKHRKPAPTVRGAKKSDERIPKMRTAAAARQRRKSYA